MCAVLEEAARQIDDREMTTVIAPDSSVSNLLPESLNQAIPDNAMIVADRGFSYLPVSDQALQNGEISVFVEDLNFQTKVTLYEDFLSILAQFDPGEEKTIGYLTVTNVSNTLAMETIPLILKSAS